LEFLDSTKKREEKGEGGPCVQLSGDLREEEKKVLPEERGKKRKKGRPCLPPAKRCGNRKKKRDGSQRRFLSPVALWGRERRKKKVGVVNGKKEGKRKGGEGKSAPILSSAVGWEKKVKRDRRLRRTDPQEKREEGNCESSL